MSLFLGFLLASFVLGALFRRLDRRIVRPLMFLAAVAVAFGYFFLNQI